MPIPKSVVRPFQKAAATFRAGSRTLPQRYFTSSEVFADEQKNIFAHHWVVVGHAGQIPDPGAYFVADIAGESLIIVRRPGGEIRAFYNVCRHRGTRLCEEQSGHIRAIQCPYHAWTYSLDGQLIGAPHMDEVPGFDRASYSLHSADAALWEGFIFVNLASHSSTTTRAGGYTPFGGWFAPLGDKFSEWNLPNLRPAKRIQYDVRANWKLIFQNYSECYHCPGVHPALSKVSPYDSAENDLSEGPFLGGYMRLNRGASLTMSGNVCALPVGEINTDDHHRVYYYSIFPNMLLSLHPDYVMVHQVWPKSPDRTLILCDWLFHPDAFDRPDFQPDDAIEFWDMTNRQDWHVCELSHQGISSRVYTAGPYSSRESIPAAWDRYYLGVMG